MPFGGKKHVGVNIGPFSFGTDVGEKKQLQRQRDALQEERDEYFEEASERAQELSDYIDEHKLGIRVHQFLMGVGGVMGEAGLPTKLQMDAQQLRRDQARIEALDTEIQILDAKIKGS